MPSLDDSINVGFTWNTDSGEVDPNSLTDHQITNAIGYIDHKLDSVLYDAEIDHAEVGQLKLMIDGFRLILKERVKNKKNPPKNISMMFVDISTGEVIQEVSISRNKIPAILKEAAKK